MAGPQFSDVITLLEPLKPVRPGEPVRLIIPSINVAADVKNVGLNATGAMIAPLNRADVAWLALGARPGESGVAVIAGHYGRLNGRPSVFDNLHKLQPGDLIVVQDAAAVSYTYTVRLTKIYEPTADAAAVFDSIDGGSHLNLITCGGVWDARTKSFTTRMVIFADMS